MNALALVSVLFVQYPLSATKRLELQWQIRSFIRVEELSGCGFGVTKPAGSLSYQRGGLRMRRMCIDCSGRGVLRAVPLLWPKSRGWVRDWSGWLCPVCVAKRRERKREDNTAFWQRIDALAKQIL